jgi:DNA-binding protein H-NS
MARVNVSSMTVEELLNLRKRVDDALTSRRAVLEKQLRELSGDVGRRESASPLAGKRVRPKYRSADGQTWAGRGQQPRWLAEAIKAGQSPEDFLIEKVPAAVAKKKRRAKR